MGVVSRKMKKIKLWGVDGLLRIDVDLNITCYLGKTGLFMQFVSPPMGSL